MIKKSNKDKDHYERAQQNIYSKEECHQKSLQEKRNDEKQNDSVCFFYNLVTINSKKKL